MRSLPGRGEGNGSPRVADVCKGGGQIRTGRILDYLGKPNRKMCSLYLSLLEKAGLRLPTFGDSTEKLAEI